MNTDEATLGKQDILLLLLLIHILCSYVVPEGVPTITGATPITVTSLLVTWQPPLQAQTNGPLTGYSFQFRQLPGGSFMEETISDAGVTEHELLNLVRYQNYEVKLAATNSIGLGPYSAPVYVYIGEAGKDGLLFYCNQL